MSTEYSYTSQSLRAGLHTLILGRRIEMHEQVGSTNDLARQAGRRGEPEGLVVVAEEQLTGRGRLDRVWTAPPGCCILCSVLLRPRFSPYNAFYLTIATALAVYRACGALWEGDAQQTTNGSGPHSIKWPNDVLVNGRKVAGVLCESELTGDDWEFAVVGFGINANLEPEQLQGLRSSATSLSAELGQPVDRGALLCRVLEEMEALYLTLQNGQFGLVYSQWAARLGTIGKRVSVRDGTQMLEGMALRVDFDGALILKLDDGSTRRVLAGDIT
jgi:BirA family biotin operon repressor/biotin-[acetyl-CoA-carboxylase] ligase